MITTHVDRIPSGHLVDRVGDHVGDQPEGRRGREHIGAPREVTLMMSFWVVPASCAMSAPCLSAAVRQRASNHIAGALIVMDVFICCNGMSSNRAACRRCGRSVRRPCRPRPGPAPRRGQYPVCVGRSKSDGQTGLALGQVAPVQSIGLRRRRVPCVRFALPRAGHVTRRWDTARATSAGVTVPCHGLVTPR